MSPELLFPGRHAIRLALVLFLASGAAACESSSGSDPPGPPALVQVVSGNAQQTTVGAELPEPLTVRVMDEDDRPVPEQLVHFVVISGGGSVYAGSALTDRGGAARERWTLGTVAGDTQRVEARVLVAGTGQPLSGRFTAVGVPDAPAAVAVLGPADRAGPAGATLDDSLMAAVQDRYGNPVPQTTVVWTVRSGGGTVSPAQSATDAAGIARTSWTLGTRLDSAQVVDAAAGLGLSTEFRAAALAPDGATLAVVSGDAQAATVGARLPEPLVVRVTLPDGRPLAGATVKWSLPRGHVTPPVAITDAEGLATVLWSLGVRSGTQTVTASTPGSLPAAFQATAWPEVPAEIAGTVGNNQSGSPGMLLPSPLAVRVSDRFGNRVPDQLVRWSVAPGSGSVEPDTSRTDWNGIARTQWTLGLAAGSRTVTAQVGALAPVSFRATVTSALTLTVQAPAAKARVGDVLPIAVTALSDREVRSVTAEVATRSIALTSAGSSRWQGSLSLAGLPRGGITLRIAVLDAAGRSAYAVLPLFLDRAPNLRVAAPRPGTLALPTVAIAATCEDDDPGGCAFRVYAGSDLIAEAVGEIATTITVPRSTTGTTTLRFLAQDSAGQTDDVRRAVYVLDDRWEEIATANTRVWDVDENNVLLVDSSSAGIVLYVRDRVTGATSRAYPASGPEPDNGFVSPRGALIVTDWPSQLFEWRDGALIQHGPVDNPSSLVRAGQWAIWNDGAKLYRRDLLAGSTVQVAADATKTGNDVAPNGDVAYWNQSNDVVWVRNGVATPLTHDDDGVVWNAFVKTDGVNVVYTKHSPCCPIRDYRIALHTGSAEEILADYGSVQPYPGQTYAARDGWVAFTALGAGSIYQVWARAPDGTRHQITSSGTNSFLVALGPGGRLVFNRDRRTYLAAPPYTTAPVDLGNLDGRMLWAGDELILLLGRSALRLK